MLALFNAAIPIAANIITIITNTIAIIPKISPAFAIPFPPFFLPQYTHALP